MNWGYLFEYRPAYGIAEIAEALGERPATVAQWHRRKKLWFPPDVVLKCGPVWFGKEVLDATGSECGIECWLAHQIEHHLGLTNEECVEESEGWDNPNPLGLAASEAHWKAEEHGYLSPLILGLVSCAARAYARGESEKGWRQSVLEINDHDPFLEKALRKAKLWMKEDGFWPWASDRTAA